MSVCKVAAVLFLAALVAGPAHAQFITANSKGFTDSCGNDYTFAGFDVWRLLEAAAGINGPGNPSSSELNGLDTLDYLFTKASAANLTWLRFFGVADDDGGLPGGPLQTAPGQYNEQLFVGFDKIIAALPKYNIKASIVLIDFWKQTDGVQQYLAWCAGNTSDVSVFYSSSACNQLYFNHVTTVLNRVNTITGVAYKNDPNIFGWEIINEPRCIAGATSGTEQAPASCVQALQTFIDKAAAHIKSIDKNHLVTVGEEGFFDTSGQYESANPRAVQGSGQSFENNHKSANIDYASMHLWPDNWNNPILPMSFDDAWISDHEAASTALGKPLVLSEFGIQCLNGNSSCQTSTRNPYFSDIYQVETYDIQVPSSTFTGPITAAGQFVATKNQLCPAPNAPSLAPGAAVQAAG
ncbi:hypothetical protein WJX73_000055 [Symbiochloris irregularis]|uniref:mannan endo-1,4-beta-mannosidase n=1 Tax=Symbiochloris irregularis TaxID=706552 RepID=A0AAW1P477_9CHLO